MNQRQQQIYDAIPESFDWIWSTSFASWLGSATEGFFWISGKPASGKSTLMKHLASTRDTLRYLSRNGSQWTRIHFYFDFRAGEGIANTIDGLLRSFALQLSNELPNQKDPFPELTISGSFDEASLGTQNLIEAICRAIERNKMHVLAFVDGLDEYQGDLVELARTLGLVANRSGMKMCLASRPEPEFSNTFRDYPTIKMQDFNGNSIRFYMEASIESMKHNFRSIFPEFLRDQVVTNAQGVILWAHFAIDELLDGCYAGDTGEKLAEILNDFPQNLGEVYQRSLDRLLPKRKGEAALILHLISNAGGAVNLGELLGAWAFIFYEIDGILPSAEEIDSRRFENRLLALFGSLMEITDGDDNDSSKSKKSVRAVHKTLQSYLMESSWVGKHMPLSFKERYPDWPWLRIYASVINDASKEIKADIHNPKSSLRESSISEVQRLQDRRSSYLSLPYALEQLPTLAEGFERRNGSSYHIIKNPLSSILLYFHIESCRGCSPGIQHENFPQSRDLACAITHGLSGYLQDCLPAEPAISKKEMQGLVDIAFTYMCNDSFFPPAQRLVSLQSREIVTRVIATHGGGIQSRHIRELVSHCYDFSGDERSAMSCCKNLLQDRPSDPWPWVQDQTCGGEGSLLWYWATRPRRDNDNPVSDFRRFGQCLGFLLGIGESIKSRCYRGGNVLHAILEPTLAGHEYRSPPMPVKFVLAIKAGANHRERGRRGTPEESAKKLRNYLYLRLLINRRQSDDISRELREAKTIIGFLKDHRKHGNWSRLEDFHQSFRHTGIRRFGKDRWEDSNFFSEEARTSS